MSITFASVFGQRSLRLEALQLENATTADVSNTYIVDKRTSIKLVADRSGTERTSGSQVAYNNVIMIIVVFSRRYYIYLLPFVL